MMRYHKAYILRHGGSLEDGLVGQREPQRKRLQVWLDSVVTKLSAEMARIHKGGRRIFAYRTAAGFPLADGNCTRRADIVLSSVGSYNTDENLYDPDVFSVHERRISWEAGGLTGGFGQTRGTPTMTAQSHSLRITCEKFSELSKLECGLMGSHYTAKISGLKYSTETVHWGPIHNEPLLFVKGII